MASGGPRVGTPGTPYPNRSDLANPATQAPAASTGQPYGQRGQQIAAQRAIPLPAFDAPSARPNEPITAGMNSGPGPSQVEAGIPSPVGNDSAQVADQLRAIASIYPTDDLSDLIALLTEQSRQ